MHTVFRSKLDTWLVAVVLLSALPAFAAMLTALRAGENWLPHAAVGVAVLLLPVGLLLPTRYTVADGEVAVRCGPLRWRIPVRDITRIVPSRSLVSSPALSLDRLKIEYGPRHQALLVSPADPAGFIAAVMAARSATVATAAAPAAAA